MAREEFIEPVGFASEPVTERRRWVARILLGALMVLLAWLVVNRVISPPEDTGPTRGGIASELPAPV